LCPLGIYRLKRQVKPKGRLKNENPFYVGDSRSLALVEERKNDLREETLKKYGGGWYLGSLCGTILGEKTSAGGGVEEGRRGPGASICERGFLARCNRGKNGPHSGGKKRGAEKKSSAASRLPRKQLDTVTTTPL